MKQYNELIYPESRFTWHEALYMKRMQAYAELTESIKQEVISTAVVMDTIRNFYNTPVIITSWVRTPEYNKLIGGAPKSHHLEGTAVDFVVQGVSVAAVHRDLSEGRLNLPVRWEADATTWVHIDRAGIGPFKGYPGRKTR